MSGTSRILTVDAEPYEFAFDPSETALLVIDMQRDFVERGGFGEMLGNDVTPLRRAIAPTRGVLDVFRRARLTVIHTREGHRPDLSDCPPSKRARGRLTVGIGDLGPMGRVLVRGERGHDIIDELKPLPAEPVIDKPGKGAFYATDLELVLGDRKANDRGYECLVLEDCVASYFPQFQAAAIAMIKAQRGIFGWVSTSGRLLTALDALS
ncbi:MAG: cysteine hydrolase [Candidatus Rokuibacteriota bacterium]|nr:MAG: cysteine hydrolase [Candidatus Rokubacteria bacterium]